MLHHLFYSTPIAVPQLQANGLKHRVLIQYGKGDAQVSWVGALQMGRSVGGTAMYSSNIKVGNETFYGFLEVDDNESIRAGSAIVGIDFGAPLSNIPFDNNPASSSTDSHGKVGRFIPGQDQSGTFLRTGEITNTCGGPCIEDDGGGAAKEHSDGNGGGGGAAEGKMGGLGAGAYEEPFYSAVIALQRMEDAVAIASARANRDALTKVSPSPSSSASSAASLSAAAAAASAMHASAAPPPPPPPSPLSPLSWSRSQPSPVHVEQYGMCQCPMTSSWFSTFYDSCLKGNPAMLKLVNFTQYYIGGKVGGKINATTWNSSFHGYGEVIGDRYGIVLSHGHVVDSRGPVGGTLDIHHECPRYRQECSSLSLSLVSRQQQATPRSC